MNIKDLGGYLGKEEVGSRNVVGKFNKRLVGNRKTTEVSLSSNSSSASNSLVVNPSSLRERVLELRNLVKDKESLINQILNYGNGLGEKLDQRAKGNRKGNLIKVLDILNQCDYKPKNNQVEDLLKEVVPIVSSLQGYKDNIEKVTNEKEVMPVLRDLNTKLSGLRMALKKGLKRGTYKTRYVVRNFTEKIKVVKDYVKSAEEKGVFNYSIEKKKKKKNVKSGPETLESIKTSLRELDGLLANKGNYTGISFLEKYRPIGNNLMSRGAALKYRFNQKGKLPNEEKEYMKFLYSSLIQMSPRWSEKKILKEFFPEEKLENNKKANKKTR